MDGTSIASLPLWAVHISDGVLGAPWLAAGFVLAGVLTLLAAWRVRDEEVPRIALLTSAFFVASSIHVRLGPTSVHLLLNGLVGVVLGWRAPLAILVGVTLQAVLIPHGGFSTIGVNTCTEAIPALAAGVLFRWVRALPCARHGAFRAALVGVSAAVCTASLIFAVVVLWTNPIGELIRTNDRAGLILSAVWDTSAARVLLHPASIAAVVVVAAACAWGERRLQTPPDFPLGMLTGVLSVLATTALTGLVLLLDGAERFHRIVEFVFLAHVPVAVLEGIVLGCVVSFLARVKPELLGEQPPQAEPTLSPNASDPASSPGLPVGPPALLLALAAVLATTSPVRAHDLEASYTVDTARQVVTVESWFETGDSPRKAYVRVYCEDGSLLTEGDLNTKGVFSFSYDRVEPLRFVVSAPGGHQKSVTIPAAELGDEGRVGRPPASAGEGRSRWIELLAGVGFLLALASFWLGVRNAWLLRQLLRDSAKRQATPGGGAVNGSAGDPGSSKVISSRESPRPAPPPTGQSPR
jgi:cobalt/nickel transport system permease protein